MTSQDQYLEALALSLRPEWEEPPNIGLLRQALYDLRLVPGDQISGPLIRCYLNPETRSPGRLNSPGPWWTSPRVVQSGRQGPFRADDQSPRGVSSQEARDLARARLDAALHAARDALHPKPARNEEPQDG